MKKYIIMIMLTLVAGASLNAWHGRGYGRGYYGRGGYWGGYWGPSVGFTIPIGGSSPKYVMPVEAGDPYNQYVTSFPKAKSNTDAYRRWLFENPNYSAADKAKWWNSYAGRYNTYQANRPQPSGYFSIGTGGYWGSPYWGPGYWGRPGVSFGVGF